MTQSQQFFFVITLEDRSKADRGEKGYKFNKILFYIGYKFHVTTK